MQKLILIKYGELTTKKGNRNQFINKLNENIKKVIDAKIIKKRDRMYILTDNIDLVTKKLQKVFGLQGIVIAYQVNTNSDDIKNAVLEVLKDIKFKTFKV